MILPQYILNLRTALASPLPGWNGQKRMSSTGYDNHRIARPDHKVAGVILLLFEDHNATWNLTFIKRSSREPRDKHAGQISFPGGRAELSDSSVEQTALRELEEELGISRGEVTVIGKLTPLYVFVSNFLVHPYVAFHAGVPKFIPQESEVDRVITVHLDKLSYPDAVHIMDLRIRNHLLKDVPYYNLDGEILWGATAMITTELIQILEAL